jgi:hypothetical protein
VNKPIAIDHERIQKLIRERREADARIEELETILARKNKIILLLALADEPQQLRVELLDA